MKKVKSITLSLVLLTVGIMLMSACSGKGIEGHWVLNEEIEYDGNVLKKADLDAIGVSEEYTISGNEVHYVCNTSLASKPIEIDFELVDKGNNTYDFNMNSFVFASDVKVKGNKMSYYVGEGTGRTQMIYVRK